MLLHSSQSEPRLTHTEDTTTALVGPISHNSSPADARAERKELDVDSNASSLLVLSSMSASLLWSNRTLENDSSRSLGCTARRVCSTLACCMQLPDFRCSFFGESERERGLDAMSAGHSTREPGLRLQAENFTGTRVYIAPSSQRPLLIRSGVEKFNTLINSSW